MHVAGARGEPDDGVAVADGRGYRAPSVRRIAPLLLLLVAGAVRGKTEVLPTSIYLEISIGKLEPALAVSVVMILMAFVVLLALKTFSKSTLFGTGGVR